MSDDNKSKKWALFGVQGAALTTILSVSWYESGLGFEELRHIALIASAIGAVSSVGAFRQDYNEIKPEVRDRAIERSKRQSEAGIPWYAAPVFWIPVVMLLTIWYFI